jgi:hypothetical protein
MEREFANDGLAEIVWESFARSRDFNGVSLSSLARISTLDLETLKQGLALLIREGKVTLAFESVSVNPHIKRLKDLPVEIQISQMENEAPDGICAYPSSMIAAAHLGNAFDDRPYTRRLAIAEPQLLPVFFELPVLERYFRDPRYLCWFGDSAGYISIGDKAYESEETRDRDKVTIQSFGIGYDSQRRRVVAVFLCYLSDLSTEHQMYWKTHEVDEKCIMNSDYERASIWGAWPEYFSAYAAFIEEQIEIDKLCELIGKPKLFKETYEGHKRPLLFCSMLRPTQACFGEFVHLLDKMISDNIDREFFKGDIPLEEENRRGDGSIEVRQLGTIALLERWLKRHYKNRDGKDVSAEVVAPLKKIRKSRQPIAHAIGKDEYDPSFPEKQDELLGEMKNGLTRLRWILSSHPDASSYEAPGRLDGDKIVFY